MKFIRTKRFYFDCLLMVVLAIISACNYELFIVKNNFAPAGFNGIGTMLEYKFGFDIGYFTILVNAPLCILAFFLVDPEFSIKTFLFCLVYAVVCIVLQMFSEQLASNTSAIAGINSFFIRFSILSLLLIVRFIREKTYKKGDFRMERGGQIRGGTSSYGKPCPPLNQKQTLTTKKFLSF